MFFNFVEFPSISLNLWFLRNAWPTNGQTDQRTNGRTKPLLELHFSIKNKEPSVWRNYHWCFLITTPYHIICISDNSHPNVWDNVTRLIFRNICDLRRFFTYAAIEADLAISLTTPPLTLISAVPSSNTSWIPLVTWIQVLLSKICFYFTNVKNLPWQCWVTSSSLNDSKNVAGDWSATKRWFSNPDLDGHFVLSETCLTAPAGLS